jgi:hypothetical protein
MARCDGSGKPTRTDGGCDRCAATDVRGESKPTDYSRLCDEAAAATPPGEKALMPFAICPTFTYYEATDHEAVPYARAQN